MLWRRHWPRQQATSRCGPRTDEEGSRELTVVGSLSRQGGAADQNVENIEIGEEEDEDEEGAASGAGVQEASVGAVSASRDPGAADRALGVDPEEIKLDDY